MTAFDARLLFFFIYFDLTYCFSTGGGAEGARGLASLGKCFYRIKKRPREGAVSNSKSDDKSVAQIMRLNARRAEQDNVIAALANGGGEAEAVGARLIGEAFRAIGRHQNRAGQTRQHNAAIV